MCPLCRDATHGLKNSASTRRLQMAASNCVEEDEGWLLVSLAVAALLSAHAVARAARRADAIRLDGIASYEDFLQLCAQLPAHWVQGSGPAPHGEHHGLLVQADVAHALNMRLTCDEGVVVGRGTDAADACRLQGHVKGGTLHGGLRFAHGRPTCVRLHRVDDPQDGWPAGWYGVCFTPSAVASGVLVLCDREISDDVRARCRHLCARDPWRQLNVQQLRGKKPLYELLFSPPSSSSAATSAVPMIAAVLHSRSTLLLAGGFLATCIAAIINGSIVTLSAGLPAIYGGWWAALLSMLLFGVSCAYCSRDRYRWHAVFQMALWSAFWLATMCTFVIAVMFDYHAMAVTANAKVCKEGIGVIEADDWLPDPAAELVVEPSCEMRGTCACLHIDTCDAPAESGRWSAECLVFEPYDRVMTCEGSAEMITWHMSLSIGLSVLAMVLCIAFLCALPPAAVHYKRKRIVQSLLHRFEHVILSHVSASWEADEGRGVLEEGNAGDDDGDEMSSLLAQSQHNPRDQTLHRSLSARRSKVTHRGRWLGRFRAENDTLQRLDFDDDEGASDIELIEMTAHQQDLIPSSMFETSRLQGIGKVWPPEGEQELEEE